jgi:predicted CoA-binding protein
VNEESIKAFLNKKNVFAVVGVSRNPKKYGYQVYRDLCHAGYSVYCVNPNVDEILGDKCYPSLEALPIKPDVVDVVVPPKTTEEVVRTCKNIGIMKVWMQPGSESEKAIKFCLENGIQILYGLCVMVERSKHDVNTR